MEWQIEQSAHIFYYIGSFSILRLLFWCTALSRVLWDCCLSASCILFLARLFSFMQLTVIQWIVSVLRMWYDSVQDTLWHISSRGSTAAFFMLRFYLYICKPWYGCVRHKHFLIIETRNRSHPHPTPSYSKYEGISFIFQSVVSIVNMCRSFSSIHTCQTCLCELFVL